MKWPLRSVDDIEAVDVGSIIELANEYRTNPGSVPDLSDIVVGLVFFETSLRTRVGFHAAATRLDAHVIEVTGARSSPLSMGESWNDTIRVVAGYTDVLVGRVSEALDDLDTIGRPFISGGHRGPSPEHPTQSLADLYAMRTLAGRDPEHLALVGDPGMRSARSLVKLLTKTCDTRLSVVTHPSLAQAAPDVMDRLEVVDEVPADVDVVYVTGMHHESIPLPERDRLIVGADTVGKLRADALVLSPMPIIDEIHPAARADPRTRVLEQSDLALFVRMAVLAIAARETRSLNLP